MMKPAKPRNIYRKPTVFNNWGLLEYSLNGCRLSPGDQISVRWPDKTVTTESIVGENYTTTVSDWGRSTVVVTQKLFIKTHLRGKKVLIPLDELKIKALTSS